MRSSASLDGMSGLALLPAAVLPSVLRHLPRWALLQLTLTSREICQRVSSVLSNEQTSTAIGFDRRLRVPTVDGTFDGSVQQLESCLRSLGHRFRVAAHSWVLYLVLDKQSAADVVRCCGMEVTGPSGVFAAVATSLFDVELVSGGSGGSCTVSHGCVRLCTPVSWGVNLVPR